MTRRALVLDVFTDHPLEGNPVAILFDSLDLSSERMQRFARETNLSETVFVGDLYADPVPIRIFTPAAELPFAGHPVLGTAYAVAEQRGDQPDEVRLSMTAGVVPVRFSREGGRIKRGEMDQPLPTPCDLPHGSPEDALHALGVEAPSLPLQAYTNGPVHAYVELPGAELVRALQPDFGALAQHGQCGFTTYALGGAGDGHREVLSRVFVPGLGIPEDPATGSAAGPLAVHLLRHGRVAPGEWIRIEQGVQIGRPSVLWACVEGDAGAVTRVRVAGGAVTVARADWNI